MVDTTHVRIYTSDKERLQELSDGSQPAMLRQVINMAERYKESQE